MKPFISILALFLLIWVSGAMADEDYEYETDGIKSIDAVQDGRNLNGTFPYKDNSGYARFWMVGDSGLVLRYKATQTGTSYPKPWKLSPDPDYGVQGTVVLNDTHNLSSISFQSDNTTGWIVGYVNGGANKWKGVIYYTTNGGQLWQQQTQNISPFLDIPTPFLKVHAVGNGAAWISCGNGEVLWTNNSGENWLRLPVKPGGASHYGWLNGLYAFNNAIAWVASDQTGLVSKIERNQQGEWHVYDYYPGINQINPLDPSLIYFDIQPAGSLNEWNKIYILASNGKALKTVDGGNNWSVEYPDRRIASCQWWKACANMYPLIVVGTGSIRKWPCLGYSSSSNPFDLNDVGYITDNWGNQWCVALGTPKSAGNHLYRTVKYWYQWYSNRPFCVENLRAYNNADHVDLYISIANYTGSTIDTLRVLIWKSPNREGGSVESQEYTPIASPLFTNIEPGTNEKYITHTPDDSISYSYGATLFHQEPWDINYSPNTEIAKA